MTNKEINIDITLDKNNAIEGIEGLKIEENNLIEAVVVKYCDSCKFPEEYCEYSHPILFKKGTPIQQTPQPSEEQSKPEEKKSEEEEAKQPETKKSKKEKNDNFILIELAKRSKKKHTTQVFNLEKFGLNMKDVAKLFSKKFACSSTVTKEDNGKEGITLTGEFGYEIVDFLTEKFPNIKPEMCQVKEPKEKK